jgi:hypothetical protein
MIEKRVLITVSFAIIEVVSERGGVGEYFDKRRRNLHEEAEYHKTKNFIKCTRQAH